MCGCYARKTMRFFYFTLIIIWVGNVFDCHEYNPTMQINHAWFSYSINRNVISFVCVFCQVCVRAASAPRSIGSGRSRRRTARWWCVLTPTSCETAGTGSMRTVITEPATGIRWRCRWAGTGCPPAAWTLTFTCGTAKQMLSTSLKVFVYLLWAYSYASERV